MTVSASHSLPDEMLRPDAKEQVIQYLANLPIRYPLKRQLLGRWAREFDVDVTGADFARLVTGISKTSGSYLGD